MSYQQPPEHQAEVPAGPPPGWYLDPGGLTAVRWWDGTQWGQQTQPLPGRGQEPQIVNPQQPYGQHPRQPSFMPNPQYGTPPGQPPYQGHPQYPGTPYGQHPRRRRSHTASSPDRLPDITGGPRVSRGRDATRP